MGWHCNWLCLAALCVQCCCCDCCCLCMLLVGCWQGSLPYHRRDVLGIGMSAKLYVLLAGGSQGGGCCKGQQQCKQRGRMGWREGVAGHQGSGASAYTVSRRRAPGTCPTRGDCLTTEWWQQLWRCCHGRKLSRCRPCLLRMQQWQPD